MFEKIDEQLLDALCDRLKPALFTENSFITREGNPMNEIVFLMRDVEGFASIASIFGILSGSIHSIGGHGQPALYKQHDADTVGTNLKNL
ncbi:hypothetical protein P3S68_028160 [Capsicum galapagoense]